MKGKETKIEFWNNKWNSDTSLKKFPKTYNNSNSKQATILEMSTWNKEFELPQISTIMQELSKALQKKKSKTLSN